MRLTLSETSTLEYTEPAASRTQVSHCTHTVEELSLPYLHMRSLPRPSLPSSLLPFLPPSFTSPPFLHLPTLPPPPSPFLFTLIPDGPVVRDPIAFTLLTDLLSPTPSFSLNCTSHSFPPTELSWSRDEQPLPLSEAPYQSSQQLRDALSTTYDNLLTVNGSLPGLYNCTAANERGSQSNTLDVTSELLVVVFFLIYCR